MSRLITHRKENKDLGIKYIVRENQYRNKWVYKIVKFDDSHLYMVCSTIDELYYRIEMYLLAVGQLPSNNEVYKNE